MRKYRNRIPFISRLEKRLRSTERKVARQARAFKDQSRELARIAGVVNDLAEAFDKRTARQPADDNEELSFKYLSNSLTGLRETAESQQAALRRLGQRIDALVEILEPALRESVMNQISASPRIVVADSHSDSLQADAWTNAHGMKYVVHHLKEDWQKSRVEKWRQILSHFPDATSCFEIGCNIGTNLRTIRHCRPEAVVSGLEINPYAALEAEKISNGDVFLGEIASHDFKHEQYDLVFSRGVLIHINPDKIEEVITKMISAASKYLLIWENYSPAYVPHSRYNRTLNSVHKTDGVSYQHWLDFWGIAEAQAKQNGIELQIVGTSEPPDSTPQIGKLIWRAYRLRRE